MVTENDNTVSKDEEELIASEESIVKTDEITNLATQKLEKESEKKIEDIERRLDEKPPFNSDLVVTPSLGSIEDLMLETQKEMGKKRPDKIELDLKTIQEIWASHRESVSSPATKATLEKVKIDIINDAIRIIVPSSMSKEEISQEIHLYQKVREKFNNLDLNIIIEVDRAQFPDLADSKTLKMYTMKEKYDYLSDKNPELDNLVKKLKLKIDQE